MSSSKPITVSPFLMPCVRFALASGLVLLFSGSAGATTPSWRAVAADPSRIELGETVPLSPDLNASAPSSEERPYQVAGHNEKNDGEHMDRLRRTGPAPAEVRGHEKKMQVRRRGATPIPRLQSNTRKSRYGYNGRQSYNTPTYPSHSYHSSHVHHSHCGHSYWERHHSYEDDFHGYGDAFSARTLGRSCIYGKNGEVIFKPADVICAPDQPVAQDAPRNDSRVEATKPETRPRPRQEARPRPLENPSR